LLDVTFLPYHFLVALWAAMGSGIIADRKKMPHGLDEEKDVPQRAYGWFP
jgi:hypothetical protein